MEFASASSAAQLPDWGFDMSDELNALIDRVNRLEAMAGSFSTSYLKADLQDAIDAARKNDAAALARLQDEVRELRAQLSVTAHKTDLTALNNKMVDSVHHLLADVISDEAVRMEKYADAATSDALRAVKRDVSAAVDAAASNIKSAEALLSRYAEELGS
jgi:hypothetical protein